MKNVGNLAGKLIAMLAALIFVFLAFVSFNTNSASIILEAASGGGFFYKKSVHVFEGLLVLIAFQIFASLSMLFFLEKLDAKKIIFIFKAYAIVNLLLCFFIYIYASIFPWSVPTIS